AAIPVDRLRASGVLDKLLRLAAESPPPPVAETPAGSAITTMTTEDLVRLALSSGAS
ncbi:MAG: hypothetical protein HOZ81_36330, partial [Streptomyces sp.]|nr:hypothetical protein [Streptomyces sp.]